jgi:hypothetical protein
MGGFNDSEFNGIIIYFDVEEGISNVLENGRSRYFLQ